MSKEVKPQSVYIKTTPSLPIVYVVSPRFDVVSVSGFGRPEVRLLYTAFRSSERVSVQRPKGQALEHRIHSPEYQSSNIQKFLARDQKE